MSKKYLSREDILQTKLKIETVSVPEWGGDIHIKAWSANVRQQYYKETTKMVNGTIEYDYENMVRGMVKSVALSICDEAGNILFTQEDVQALTEKDAGALQKINDAVLKINGMDPKSVEAAAKNS